MKLIILEIWFFFEFVNNGNSMIFEILEFGKFLAFLFSIWKSTIWFQKMENFGFFRPFDIPHYSKFRQFSFLIFEILSLISKNLKFGKLGNFPNCYSWLIWKTIKYLEFFNFKHYRIKHFFLFYHWENQYFKIWKIITYFEYSNNF